LSPTSCAAGATSRYAHQIVRVARTREVRCDCQWNEEGDQKRQEGIADIADLIALPPRAARGVRGECQNDENTNVPQQNHGDRRKASRSVAPESRAGSQACPVDQPPRDEDRERDQHLDVVSSTGSA
jgi:hypothetical protein